MLILLRMMFLYVSFGARFFLFGIFGFIGVILIGVVQKKFFANQTWKEFFISIAVGCKISLEFMIELADPPTFVGSIKIGLLFQNQTIVKKKIKNFKENGKN